VSQSSLTKTPQGSSPRKIPGPLTSESGSIMNTSTLSYPRWETARTILRPYDATDERAFLSLWSDPVVQRWSFFEDLSPSQTEWFLQRMTKSIDKGSIFFVVVEDKERHEVLGHVSLNYKPPPNHESVDASDGSAPDAAVGIALKARYRGRGFGTEVMHWLITYGFGELGLRRISLTVLEDNIPAVRMYKKM